ncbi:MAG: MSMEG_0568 family radical SAM protein [Candidatus Dormiibacterota bacterium]|jgi:radical SAM protein (TIGR04043 family)
MTPPDLGQLITDLQSLGLRTEMAIEARRGGAGPADTGLVWIEGVPVTVPVAAGYVNQSPYVLRHEDDGWGVYKDSARVASATLASRPRYYELTTADGIPYWKIALLHLDSLASTVIQKCAYWGNEDQCAFCGIELSLEAGRTVAVKRPEHLAEVALAARDLDGAADVTLTTGSTRGPDRGALYLTRCARAIKEATGLPIEAQFEPPLDLSVMDRLRDSGVDSVGIHIESFDPAVLARVAPAKARTGFDGYVRAWQRAVEVFGRGQVSTYVILGMGEDPEMTVDGCRRVADMGVYPFVVPLRPVPGSLMEDWLPPSSSEVARVYQRVAPYLVERGLHAADVKAGCARCQACSAIGLMERRNDHGGDGASQRVTNPLSLRQV